MKNVKEESSLILFWVQNPPFFSIGKRRVPEKNNLSDITKSYSYVPVASHKKLLQTVFENHVKIYSKS